MPRYDKDAVKDAAKGNWPWVISKLAGVNESLLDGSHHPCPKCMQGKDCFNIDRNGSGGCFCNKCNPRGTSNGIDSVMWLTGWDFKEAIQKVAEIVNVKPLQSKGSDPAKHLEFMPWNETLVGMWCLKKKPIKPDAVKAIGGRIARYRSQYTVIAIPVWGPSMEKEPAVGWVLYRADGGMLPKWKKDNETPEWVKVKLTVGSKKGIITKVRDGEVSIKQKSEA